MNPAFLLAKAGGGLDQVGRLSAIRQGFQDTPSGSTQFVAAALGVIAAGGLGIMILQLWRHRPKRGPKDDYLRQAIRVLALNSDEAQVLRVLAKRSRLSHPASMLLSPANLAAAAQAAPSHRGDPKLQRDVNRLSIKLFGLELPPVDNHAAPPLPESPHGFGSSA